jgi:nitroreductase
MDLTATDHLLTTTRAVRRRLDLATPVPRELVVECIRIAQQAPTGGNRQSWHWVVVTDPAKRAALAELYRDAAGTYFEHQVARLAGSTGVRAQTARVYDSAIHLREHLHEVPVHVVPCLAGRVDGTPNATAAGFYGSILPAVWSFMLAARSRGLGTAWTTLHLQHEAAAAELLGIPTGVTQVALIPVAYFTGRDFDPAARPPVEEIVSWDTWSAADG